MIATMPDLAPLMKPVALRLLGEPNPRLSRGNDLRWGTHGTCANPVAGDGDSLRCGRTRVRIAGIDAPELHGCQDRPIHKYVAGDGYAARRKMAALVKRKRLRCEPDGRSYDRAVAVCCLPDGRDLSCIAIGVGIARRWDRRRWCAPADMR